MTFIVLLFTSRPQKAPAYHFILAFMGFAVAIAWIYVIANEIVSLLKAFGVYFGLSDAILGLTVLAWGNSLGDLIADVAICKFQIPFYHLRCEAKKLDENFILQKVIKFSSNFVIF